MGEGGEVESTCDGGEGSDGVREEVIPISYWLIQALPFPPFH